MLLNNLEERKLIQPPRWLCPNVHYLTVMGSHAYGTQRDDDSDWDLYGFAIPPRELVFSHLAGEIPGFGRQLKRFEQYQQVHVVDKDAVGGKGREYDITVYSIVKYFHLVMNNNPNMIDSLFTHRTCILHITPLGETVRENRRLFLHRGCWHTFKGYAYSQMHKMDTKEPEGKRKADRDRYGWDVKFGAHCVRLLLEVEQILAEGDLDLQRHSEQIKAIRRGEWTKEQVKNFFAQKEQHLEELYHKSALPWGPPEAQIKELLLNCLEQHYGSLNECVVRQDKNEVVLRQIAELCRQAGY